MKFPSEKKLKKIRKILEKAEGSLGLPPNATPIEKLRYDICKQFVVYKREHNLTSREFAKVLDIDESLLGKILRYRNERFTTDKLVQLLSKIHPKHSLILKVS
ncbi:MAG: transcriptional regulator [Bdellovibrionota bacterium]